MDNIGYISLYIKCDGFAHPYRVFHKCDGQNIVYGRTFENIDSANFYLKELYENVKPGFLHYNYTMPEYNAKSKNAYFFDIENDAIKEAYEYDGLAKPVYNMRPLKRAYKKLFGQRLNLTEDKIRKTEPKEKNLTEKIQNIKLKKLSFHLVSQRESLRQSHC